MTSQLDDRIRSMMQQVVDESPPPPDLPTEPRREPATQRRVPNWAVAVGAAVAVFILVGGVVWLLGGTGSGVIDEPMPVSTTPPTTTTAPVTTTTMPAIQDYPAAALARIGATWSYQGTVDDWLTEPVMLDGRYYATRKGIDEDLQVVDGQVEGEGVIEDDGELWTSRDGVTWMPAEEGEQPPPASPDSRTDGAAVVVRRNPGGDAYDMLVAEGLWATSDGTSWREIPLRPSQDNWVPWVATGGLGWVVYSPPSEATVSTDGNEAFQGPRPGNLGLWYTPDTEAWFEVTDLGPLADIAGETAEFDGEVVVVAPSDGEVSVFHTEMIVRDTDILAYVYIATSSGWVISNPHTEIWRLDLSLGEPVEAFDFSTQSLCDWFSPEDIDAIVTSTYEEFGVPLDPGLEMDRVEGQNSDCGWAWPVVTLSERHEPVDWAGTTLAPHPALGDSVLVSIHEPGFYGMMTGLDALLRVDGHPEPLWFGHTTPESVSGDVETINTLGLTIANEMLKGMGWIE